VTLVSFDLPRNVILPVDAVDVRLDPGPHPFALTNAAAIADNWRRETAANPALFDGTVVLLSELAYRDGRLIGRCHAVNYSTFMLWRQRRENSGAEHYHALSTASGTVIFRRYRVAEPADELARRISAFVATETEPEIEGPVIIRNAADLPDGLMGHMKPLIEWHFAGAD